MQDVRTARPPESWIEAQRVVFGASLLANVANPTNSQLKQVFSPASSNSVLLTEFDQRKFKARLETFPPATLEALCQTRKDRLGRFIDDFLFWQEVRDKSKWDTKKRISAFAGAKLIANCILSGHLSSTQLIRVARLELDRDWNEHPLIHEALRSLTFNLGRPFMSTQERLKAIAEFRNVVYPSRWAMVENALLQQSYSWPLLALRGEGLALPIEVDIKLGSPGPPCIISNNIVNIDQKDEFRGNEWELAAHQALDGARGLWLLNHGSYPAAFQDAIKNASIVIDLTIAEEIIKPFADWPAILTGCDGNKFTFSGDSLGVYLSLVAFSHFIDKSAMETTCATGVFKEDGELRDINGSDWRIIEPGHIDKKIRIAGSTFFFDKMIIPESEAPIETTGHLRVFQGHLLSHFATHAFGQKWQRHLYIRCPDVAHAFKPKYRRWVDQSEVDTIIRRLATNGNPVLELPFEAGSVARALCHIQSTAAHNAPQGRGYEQLGSFTFIRVVKNEINERFWQVVWDAISGSYDNFSKFRFVVSADAAAGILARELNRLNPTVEESVRAPDVLVLIGSGNIFQSRSSIPNNPFSRLQLQPLLPTLRQDLLPTPILGLRELIGKTRIILVPDDEMKGVDFVKEAEIDPDLRNIVKTLSIFRFGFTRQMAQHVLRIPDEECNSALGKLSRAFYNGNPYLVSAGGSGEYLLQVRIDPTELTSYPAKASFDAANAIVGFLDVDDAIVRFDYREAMTPEWLHEAQFHLNKAQGGSTNERMKAISAHERLSRIAEIFGWARVRWAAQYSKEDGLEIFDTLKTHLEQTENRGLLIHPVELVWAAKFALKLGRQAGKNGKYQDRDDMYHRRDQLLRWACDACRSFDRTDEGDKCRFVIATTRACMTMTEMPDQDGIKAARADIDFAKQFNGMQNDNLENGWFEFLGDCEENHVLAVSVYRAGINVSATHELPSLWAQTLVKYFGSCHLGDIDPDSELVACLPLPRRTVRFIRSNLNNDESGLHRLGYVKNRWLCGRKALIEHHRSIYLGEY